MTKEDFLKKIAELCTRYEEENGNDSSSIVGCFVDLDGIYEYNGEEMLFTRVTLEKVPENKEE